jgi:phosphoribosylamine--glycine ligase
VKHNIPTAAYDSFTETVERDVIFWNVEASYVLKADGLAAGKGVLIIHDLTEARGVTQHVG